MNDLNLNELRKIYSGRNVFITGHNGFKGSWLSFLLNLVGAKVTGYSLPLSSPKSHFEALNLKDKVNDIKGDIRDFDFLKSSMTECKPEFVFHLAAQALVRKSYKDAIDTFSTNIIGSANLLEAVNQVDTIRSLIYITSDKCYENIEKKNGYKEDARLGGIDPYSASKASAEIIYSSYHRSFFKDKRMLGSASARAGNVIGGGDWSEDRIIPDCVRSIENNEPILIRNPNSTRPWQHVLEPISGYLILSKKVSDSPCKFNGSWNFGPNENQNKTVIEVVENFFSKIKKGSYKIEDNKDSLHESNLLQLNCTKAKKDLGWSPRWDFKKTIDATAEWYKFIMDGNKAEVITLSQIEEYFG